MINPIQTLASGPLHRRAGVAASLAALLLAACGGGGDNGANSSSTVADAGGTAKALAAKTATTGATADAKTGATDATTAATPVDRPATRYEAARFLTQASFGPTDDDIELVMKLGYSAWIDRQFNLPATSNRAYWEAANAAIAAQTAGATAGQDQVWESFWKQAATSPDQLRLRVAFALSQIFVISAVDSNVGNEPRALAAWLDMLGTTGLTTYRQLLESVTLFPLMGIYLSHIHNQKATGTGQVPDENYAREVMQLFSIGVSQLNPDGTPVLVAGKTVDTYTPADVSGMAKVMTGWSWACPATTSSCFYNGNTGGTAPTSDPDRAFKPMVAYPAYHSTEVKNFLGVQIPAQATANPAASLKTALDTLAGHSNTAPFISRQLIQRLVTSNPSPAFVATVAGVFSSSGGDIKAVVKAILTNPESRLRNDAQGKLREPVLRLSAYLRAFRYTSDTGSWKVGSTDNAAGSLGQTPLRSPSVFNFYRPGYVAPGTLSAAAGLVAPELQLLNESSVSGWVNYMRDNLTSGVGQSVTVNGVTRRDVQRDWSAEMALAARPTELVQSVTDKLLYGQATDALRTEIATAIGKITIPTSGSQTNIDAAKRYRVNSALLLTLASPEYLVQK